MSEWQANEAALVQLASGGDQEAFATLYEHYFDPVYDFLTRLVKDREAAADLTQDTFIKAMNSLPNLQKGGSFKSWLFTIAHNSGLNHLQRASRTTPLQTGEDEDAPVFDIVDTDRFGSPEEAAEATRLSALVWEAAAGLDARQYAVLDLTLRQGLESAELADVLGVSTNNAYVMVNRMKKTLEESVAALMLFRDRRHCEQLTALLATHEIAGMSPDTRRLIERHAGRCDQCKVKRASLVAPSAIFGGLAFIPAPAGLKLSIGQLLQQTASSAANATSSSGSEEGATSSPGGGDEPPSEEQPQAWQQEPHAYQPIETWTAQSESVPPPEPWINPAASDNRKRVALGIAAAVALIFGVALVLGSGGSSSGPEDKLNPLVAGQNPAALATIAALVGTETPPSSTPSAVSTPTAESTPNAESTPSADATPGAVPTIAAMGPVATPTGPALQVPSGGGSTPIPAMPGGPGLAPGGDGPAATPTPQSVVVPTAATPTPTATPQLPAFVAPTPTPTVQQGFNVLTAPTATPIPPPPPPPTATPTPQPPPPLPPCVPQPVIAATTLNYTGTETVKTITLKSNGCSASTAFTAAPGSSWITTTPGSGSIPVNGTQVVSVRILPASMAFGINTGSVRVTAGGASVDITVRATK